MPDDLPLSEDRLAEFRRALSDHYRVEDVLGAGGMGIVYSAHDVRHDRKVVVKILRPELAVSVGPDRFLREVRIEAQLTHPHILPVYDSGEAAGLLYCVMPFIQGESLRDRLDREKQLPVDEAIRTVREIADALSFAHSHDVIHRDVKPGNILLEAGHAFLADFGLAKALSAVGDKALTQSGYSVGTPAYSSPEQVVGDEVVDKRSDLYALGCVLYEMLAGQPPFTGPTVDSVVRQHLTREPPSVTVIRPAVPEPVVEVVDRLLRKSPADRYSTAIELLRDLEAANSGEWRPGRGPRRRSGILQRSVLPMSLAAAGAVAIAWILWNVGPEITSQSVLLDPSGVAVLYLEDLSPQGDLGHVADGLTEGLIKELSRVPGLDVVSRNGSTAFRGNAVAPDSIARTLGVGTLIRGSVEPAGDRLRIALSLVEGTSGATFDRSSFELPRADLLLAQDSLTAEVAWMLRQRLGEEVHLRRRRAGASNVDAWALVQLAERAMKEAEGSLTSEGSGDPLQAYARADSLLARAQAADPRWVEPIIRRGWVAYERSRTTRDLREGLLDLEDALAHADRALAIDPNDPQGLELRGTARYWRYLQNVIPDPTESAYLLRQARADLEAALGADPSLASAHSTLSHLHYSLGDRTSALLSARLAYEADAYLRDAPDILWRGFTASYDSERFTQARTWCDRGHRRFPEQYRFWECKARELAMPAVIPDVDLAWSILERTVELTPEPYRGYQRHRMMFVVAEVLAVAELPDSARVVLSEARSDPDVDPNMEFPFLEARVRTVLGDYDEAVELLRPYVADTADEDDGSGEEWATHWWWRALRGHAGFEALVAASR